MTDSTPISALFNLHHEKYWSRDPSSWGSLNDWDIYFIENVNGCTKRDAHRSLSFELDILLEDLPVDSRGYSKANALKKSLENCNNDSGNKSLWENHISRLGTLSIMDRINRREIRSIAVQEEMERYKSEQATIRQKRPHEEEIPSTPPDKIRAVTFDDEVLAIPIESSFIPIVPVEPSAPITDTQDEDVFSKMMPSETYLKIRHDIRNRLSQKDWIIEDYNVSSSFRDYQICNIDKLEGGTTFFFSSNVEEILSLHHIMLIDLTMMKRPTYVTLDERSWRASIRQRTQPDPANFFGDLMNEYEKVINDIDELRLKFYEMWGKYSEKVIYLDEERRLFETTQIVARSL